MLVLARGSASAWGQQVFDGAVKIASDSTNREPTLASVMGQARCSSDRTYHRARVDLVVRK